MNTKLKIGIVGSGPTAAAAAWALVQRGYRVEMLDFGNEPEPEAKALAERLKQKPFAEADLLSLKTGLSKPDDVAPPGTIAQVRHLFESLLGRQSPSDINKKKLFGSTFTFKDTEEYIPVTCGGYQVPRSLSKGGLSNVWGAACYPFTDRDLNNWPITEKDLGPHYREVSSILGLAEKEDSLSTQFPIYSKDGEALVLNPQAEALLTHWNGSAGNIRDAGFHFGRARLAVLTKDRGGRRACQYTGLCLSGCPNDSIYSSAYTVDLLKQSLNFTYRPGFYVHSFRESADGQVAVRAHAIKDNSIEAFTYDKLLLGAGTLSTLRIVHQSCPDSFDTISMLDNTMFMLPLIKKSKRLKFKEEVPFTLSQLVLLIDNPAICPERIHTQLYSYSDYIFDRFRPVVRLMPRWIQLQLLNFLYNTFIMFIYLPGAISTRIQAKANRNDDAPSMIELVCEENPKVNEAIRKLLRHFFRNRSMLDLLPISAALKNTEPGFSGHLAGTFPMSKNPRERQTYDNGLLYGFRSLYLIDASTFPSLPAQNCAYTAMANAHRIASRLI